MKGTFKKLSVILIALVAFVGVAFVSACTPPKTITLSKSEITMELGETANLTAPGEDAEWTSSDESVATVTKRGVVSAKKLGETTVTAKTTEGKGTCKVYVKAKITLNSTLVELFHDPDEPAEFELEAESNPMLTGSQRYTYLSNNTSVATVSATGVITSAGEGSTTIKVTDPNGGEAIVTVNVEALSNDPVHLTINVVSAVNVPAYAFVYTRGTYNEWMNGFNNIPEEWILTRVDAKNFKLVLEMDERPEDPLAFKFVLGNNPDGKPSWSYEQTQAEDFVKRVNGGTRSVTYEVDWKVIPEEYIPFTGDTEVTFEVTTSTPMLDKALYIVGEWNDWNVADDDYKFTLKDGTDSTYTLTITVSGTSEFPYQMTFGSWDDKALEDGKAVNTVLTGLNGTAKTVTHTIAGPPPPFDGTTAVTIIVNLTEAYVGDLYLVGDPMGWTKNEDYKFTASGDNKVFTLTFDFTGASAFSFKVNIGGWDAQIRQEDGSEFSNWAVSGLDGTAKTITVNAKNVA